METTAELKARRNALQAQAQDMAHGADRDKYTKADREAIRAQINRLNRAIAARRAPWE